MEDIKKVFAVKIAESVINEIETKYIKSENRFDLEIRKGNLTRVHKGTDNEGFIITGYIAKKYKDRFNKVSFCGVYPDCLKNELFY